MLKERNDQGFWLFLVLMFFATNSIFGQSLHHHMTSAQGKAMQLDSGFYISQTIGQRSITGNIRSENFKVIQGFQQSRWSHLIAENSFTSALTLTAYPNPFKETIGFQFSSLIEGEFEILVYDISGKLTAVRKSVAESNLVRINLYFLPTGMYLVQLKNKGQTYFSKIIKD